jgi:predicted TPR repeat methyltransferase
VIIGEKQIKCVTLINLYAIFIFIMNPIVYAGHKLLAYEHAYDFYQYIVGGVAYRKKLLSGLLNHKSLTFVDLGCGTASMCSSIPDSYKYIGIDNWQPYLDKAADRFPNFRFMKEDLSRPGWSEKFELNEPAIFSAFGLLHHLNDQQALEFMSETRSGMNQESVFFSVDPIITSHSSKISKWFAKNDRGKFLRSEYELQSLFERVGFRSEFILKRNELNIPLDTIEITATKF